MPNTIFPAAGGVSPKGAGSGEMLGLINSFDWGGTAVGPIQAWPECLRAAVRIMLSSPVPMVMLMGETGVLVYNDGYAVFAGLRHPEILGKDVAIAWPEIAEFNLEILKRVLSGETVSFTDQKMTLDRTGVFEDLWLDLNYSPVLDERGVPIAELVIVSEMTKRVLAERALARSEERLSLALDASGIVGVFDWDLIADRVTADERFDDMFGVDPEASRAGAPIATYIDSVHVSDREVLTAAIEKSIAERSPFRAEYRLAGRRAEERWVLATGRVIVDPDGTPVRLAGVAVDITDQKMVAEQLAQSEAKFRAIADSMPQMVWSTLPDGYHDYYNARWYEYTGVPEGSTDGEGWNGMFHPDDQEKAWAAWRHSLATGEPYQIEYRLRHHSGEYRWTLGRAMPIRGNDGRIVRWFGTCTDIHETKLVAEEREIVAQELSHRIKNIFSVMSGIVALSARTYPELAPLASTLRARISALGVAHDFVRPHSAASRPAGIEMTVKGLITTLLKPYRDEGDDRLSISGDDARIDERSATPISLLLHELATNSAKYGALAEKNGRVVVRLDTDPDNLFIEWKESGSAITAPARQEGFGSRLMSLSVEGQLSGRLERMWEQDGLRVRVTIPARALRRSA
ncbi:PAS domain-containing sensor histidine kinase [Mesorhizobium australicum]|uniref:Blue-light-activated histidine kinase n=1 Tax=Mesorhizobium australicum TaxID=536018 RepID=A0A1X7N7U6_9HYPH|nr:PAS domain-containing protein [Mesorhizobium australicum]SMH33572.1 signal transduction histidine kinase [Mesorhizobium australicum]